MGDPDHPGARQHARATPSKRWDTEPFPLGAYLYFKVGQLTSMGPALGRAEGRVHFAGDHTSHRPGFMHGALVSARRVVDEIVRTDA